MLQTNGFTLRVWLSSHSTFLVNIPTELQETRQILILNNEDGITTFELLWNPTNDQFQVKNNTTHVQTTNSRASTKRMVLASTASIYHLLGLLSPAFIVQKFFLQKL